ncbi:hypothetical protein GH714_035588 [Hevea brasiliensis]|uniref:Uncharacterized protein n=1 Tax=Hevea brasiliensis TaxID=3981 RepID=A0A6A6M6W6_HEVBR|nr:hypothetical protein GH714_035588 [Hevea brasiliensis]
MARVKQVSTKPRKFMGDAMKAAASSEKEREEGTEVENSNDETETVAERARKRKGKGNKRNEWTDLDILEKSHELQKGIMAEHNAKMDMLINRLDRQEWFMKKMAQMLFGESFGKFGDFGSYPQGTAGPSNAKAAGPSGVKISEVEEEEEEHVEAAEKVQEESKLAEVEEVEKNDEKEKSAEEASETEQEPAKRHQENPPHLILQATAAVTMEKVKAEMVQDKKRRRKSSHKTH